MADNITYTNVAPAGVPNSTKQVTDEHVTDGHMPVVKLATSGDGERTLIPGDTANGLDVDVTRSALPTGASTSANQTTIIGHLDGVEGLLTTIDADTGTLAGTVAGTEVQVDVVGALPAGNNNIGDVDIASLPNEGQQNMAGSISVAIASDQSTLPISGTVDTELTTADLDTGAGSDVRAVVGIVSAESGGGVLVGSGNPLPVSAASLPLPSGAATAANQSTIIGHVDGIEGLLTTIDADTSALAGAVSGTEVQVDVVGALPAGDNNIGNVDIVTLPNEGQQTMANSISVAIASDQSALPVSATNLDIRDLTSASDSVTVHGDVGIVDQLDLANANPLAVAIVDASGDQITSFGGGTQYTEGDTDASITGTAVMWEDAGNTLRPASAATPLPVEIIAGAGSGGTAMADDDPFTVDVTSFTPVGGTYRSVRDTVNDNDAGAFAMTASRAIMSTLETPNGDSAMDDTADAVKVSQATHDNLNLNANLQVGNSDVANGNPVPISDAGGAITVDGSVTANAGTNLNTSALALESGGNLAAIAASASVLDDWDETDRAKVNIIAGQAGITAGAGAVGASTPRVTLASDDPAVAALQLLDNAVSGSELQVDIVSAPTLTVQATNLDIRDLTSASDSVAVHGDVGVIDQLDLTNSNPAVVAIVDGNGDQITSFGGGTQYTEGDTDATITGTAMMMEGAGNALVPAQGTTTDGLLVNLGSNNDVAATSVIPGTGATNLGKAEDSGHTSGDTGVMALGVRNDTPTSLAGTDLDYTPIAVDQYGFLKQSNLDVTIQFTRPNDTTAYASGDTISDSTSAPTAFTASSFARNNAGAGRIERIILTMSTAAATKANLELWIFDESYTNNNDNAAFAPSDADAYKAIAIVPLGGSPIATANNALYQAEVDIPFVCGSGSTALWCALVVRNAYTPAAQEVFNIRFLGLQFN